MTDLQMGGYLLIRDFRQCLNKKGHTQDLYAADGVHPNESGSRITADTIGFTIQQHKENQL